MTKYWTHSDPNPPAFEQSDPAAAGCVRGCHFRNRHLVTCDGFDDDDLECLGCLPRPAAHGRLCWPCHRRLEVMLTDFPAIVRWLDAHLPAGSRSASAARQDWERSGTADGAPIPIDLSVIDHVGLIKECLISWVELLAERTSLVGPRHITPALQLVSLEIDPDAPWDRGWKLNATWRQTKPGCSHLPGRSHFNRVVLDRELRAWCSDVDQTAAYLLTHITAVEVADWTEAAFDEFALLTSKAHRLAPWAPEVRHVSGIPCPECFCCALVIKGGSQDVECLECRVIVPEERYGIWIRMLVSEQQPEPSAPAPRLDRCELMPSPAPAVLAGLTEAA